MSKLKQLKNGKKNYKIVNFPGTEEKVAIIVLSSSQTEMCKINADEYIERKKIKDETYKDLVLQKFMVYEFLRDKDDLDKRIASSMDELQDLLDVSEIAYFVTEYGMLQQEHSPFLNSVTEEQFEALKKTLEKMSWKDLNGESLIALRNFLLSLV